MISVHKCVLASQRPTVGSSCPLPPIPEIALYIPGKQKQMTDTRTIWVHELTPKR
jgi:hypothetical protein